MGDVIIPKTRVVQEDLCSGQNRHRFEYDSRK